MTDPGKPSASNPATAVSGAVCEVYVFDGRGGVSRSEGDTIAVAPAAKGFVLVIGSLGLPDFRAWLREAIGEFAADILTVPSSGTRCHVVDDKAMVVLRVVRRGAEPGDLGRQLMSLYLEKGRIILATDVNVADMLGIAGQAKAHHAPVSPGDFIARMALRASDRMEPLIERMGDSLDEVEDVLMRERKADSRAKLATLRRTMIGFRRFLWPQRDVLNTLEIEDLSFLTPRDRARLREAANRTARLGDEVQALSERAVLVHEQILDQRAELLNRAMLILAAVTTIFMPLTLATGLLGMNVMGIPYADHPASFGVVVVVLLILAAILAIWFRQRKWL